MSIFSEVKWLTLQQPIILVVSMMTGKNVHEILAMEGHERAKLIDAVVGEVKDVTASFAAATDPAGPAGVTMTEEEWANLLDEADDVPEAVRSVAEYTTGVDGGSTGQ